MSSNPNNVSKMSEEPTLDINSVLCGLSDMIALLFGVIGSSEQKAKMKEIIKDYKSEDFVKSFDDLDETPQFANAQTSPKAPQVSQASSQTLNDEL